MFDKALCIHYYVGVEHHQSADFERENSAMPTNPLTQLVNDHDDDNDKGKHQLLVKSKQRDYCSVNPRPIDIETQSGSRTQPIEKTISIQQKLVTIFKQYVQRRSIFYTIALVVLCIIFAIGANIPLLTVISDRSKPRSFDTNIQSGSEYYAVSIGEMINGVFLSKITTTTNSELIDNNVTIGLSEHLQKRTKFVPINAPLASGPGIITQYVAGKFNYSASLDNLTGSAESWINITVSLFDAYREEINICTPNFTLSGRTLIHFNCTSDRTGYYRVNYKVDAVNGTENAVFSYEEFDVEYYRKLSSSCILDNGIKHCHIKPNWRNYYIIAIVPTSSLTINVELTGRIILHVFPQATAFIVWILYIVLTEKQCMY